MTEILESPTSHDDDSTFFSLEMRYAVVFIAAILIGMISTIFFVTKAQIESASIDTNITATLQENPRDAEGLVAKVSYEYAGKPHTATAPVDSNLLSPGDTIVIAVDRSSGEPVSSLPDPIFLSILYGISIGIGVAIVGLFAFVGPAIA